MTTSEHVEGFPWLRPEREQPPYELLGVEFDSLCEVCGEPGAEWHDGFRRSLHPGVCFDTFCADRAAAQTDMEC